MMKLVRLIKARLRPAIAFCGLIYCGEVYAAIALDPDGDGFADLWRVRTSFFVEFPLVLSGVMLILPPIWQWRAALNEPQWVSSARLIATLLCLLVAGKILT